MKRISNSENQIAKRFNSTGNIYEADIEEIKKNTRRFAKRQLTWFKRTENVDWFDYKETTSSIIKTIENKMEVKNPKKNY